MKCNTCDQRMKPVCLCAGIAGMEAYVIQKEMNLQKEERSSRLECYVCPKCGIIKFKAKTPDIFSDCQT